MSEKANRMFRDLAAQGQASKSATSQPEKDGANGLLKRAIQDRTSRTNQSIVNRVRKP
jgi:hypothetical protein